MTGYEAHEKLKLAVKEETALTLEIIRLLREVDRTQYFAKLGYSSLHVYATRELKYSDGSAHRRIAAMKLIREIPEAREKLESGAMNLTTVSMAQRIFSQEKRTVEQKQEILAQLENCTQKEAELKLAVISPIAQIPREQERSLTQDLVELRIVVDRETLEQLEKLKDLRSNADPSRNTGKLLKWMTAKLLEAKAIRNTERVAMAGKFPSKNPRYIPPVLRREVLTRDQYRCTYPGCGSKHLLELDHRIPICQGGPTNLENLRTLCHAHHQLASVSQLGKRNVEKYVTRLRS